MREVRILLILLTWLLIIAWYLNKGVSDGVSKLQNVMNWKTLSYAVSGGSVSTKIQRPNILFICADDLGEEISPYNKLRDKNDHSYQEVSTPNLERLASNSLVLALAYNQYPFCNPSRSSLLTGRRPNTTHVYNLDTFFREVGGNFTTIPQYFKENGYYTTGVGKVFHHHKFDVDPLSWSEPYIASSGSMAGVTGQDRSSHPDDVMLKIALAKIRTLSQVQNQPWFVAVGFRATHMIEVVPEEFLQLYPLGDITVPRNLLPPDNIPDLGKIREEQTWELKVKESLDSEWGTGGSHKTNITAMVSRLLQFRQAYYASVSYIDASIGELLDELDRLDLSHNTIVVFWTDHGLIVGEYGRWGKNAPYDKDLHCPMMLRIPGLTDGGVTVSQLTEYVDLFPTLVEVAGLPPIGQCPDNSANVSTCHEGTSMVPLIHNPTQKWKKAAFSQVILFSVSLHGPLYTRNIVLAVSCHLILGQVIELTQ